MIWRRAVTLINARVVTSHGVAESIRFARRVLEVNAHPHRGDHVCDLQGAWVLPGLVNAHDHLELNHYGPQHAGAPYRNVRQWVDDMRPMLEANPIIARGRAHSIAARIWAGGFKNLLAGVTLVAHHNPTYPGLHRASPVRVLARVGWAHSFAMATAPVGARGEPGGDVAQRFRQTPRTTPFVVHLAEGTDDEARAELPKLETVGALASNTVLVHGVGIDAAGWRTVGARGASVVWCPASNLALLGATLDIRRVMGRVLGRVALGTDSRLSGARDLLDELQVAAGVAALTADERLALVTSAAAAVLRTTDAGRLERGVSADLIVIPPHAGPAGDALTACRRAQVQLVVTGGRPRVGTPEFEAVFGARGITTTLLRVDGCTRVADAQLVQSLARYGIGEPGVEICQ